MTPDQETYERMRCGRHDDCFSARHDLLPEVKRRARLCPENCPCWRHAVLRHIEAMGGDLPPHLLVSPTAQKFDELLKERRGDRGTE